MKKQLENVKHDYIRYGSCWEDADVLLQALDIQPDDSVLSIGSAGDNSFSLLSKNPQRIVAVDINPVQLHLIELKKAAFKALEHTEFIGFLGFVENDSRKNSYQKVRKHLPKLSRDFWDQRMEELEQGVIHTGKFERYFKLFRTRILPLVHTQQRINRLFEPKSTEEQQHFFQKRWNNLRWRLLFRLFFSKFVMGRLGRDPAFLKEVDLSVSDFILEQAKQHLSTNNAQTNYFLHYILKGNFGNQLPHYAREENFETIRRNLDKLIIFNGLAEDALNKYEHFTKFNLSNIFEYMPPSLFVSVSSRLTERSPKGARFAYWNLMVPRKINAVESSVQPDKTAQKLLDPIDKGFFYAGLNIDRKL